jgi:hypothetical protein
MQLVLTSILASVWSHGAMVSPVPRAQHNQTLDERNKCGASDPYSKADDGGGPGEYCGVGCLGEACLYYQIGCYAGCPVCSLWGKDLYPTDADLVRADNCTPIEPTLGGGDPAHERELRTNNVDGLSDRGDWTRVNPWRAPGTAGRGNPDFQPCGVNSGGAAGFKNPGTTAKDVPKAGPGTALPSVGVTATWTRGSVVDASWALYANHGGGYSYRLCKKSSDGSPVTEACFQQTPLDFVGNTTKIVYTPGLGKPTIEINAITTSVGTFPAGSMWRKNPVPMCNCDLGYDCSNKGATAGSKLAAASGQDGPGMFKPYNVTNFHPGQTSTKCPTGVQYPTKWDDGAGAVPYWPGQTGGSNFEYSMIDQVRVPASIMAGEYILSWRWDCEETPQVWNSCADVTIV